MAVLLSPYGGVGAQFLDNAGNVLTGGKVFTYAAGTTTPQVAYGNSAGTTPLSNPIILNAAGRVPTGEIWLTDGLVYKFVLTTSTDVLIATYDGIVGINSNFVSFVNQQEIQTATAGQTVFNLTTMTYQPGTNSLSVFVDGVNQYGPGSSYAYLETDSDTVTFVTGLHVGAEVKFTTSNLNSSASVNDAEQVSYIPPFTGSVATNVEAKLAQYVSVKDFGAVGDGVADDTVAIQAALDNQFANGGDIYFPPGNYLCGVLTYDTKVSFIGYGPDVDGTGPISQITFSQANGVLLSAAAGANPYGTVIKNLKIVGQGKDTAGTAIAFQGRLDGSNRGMIFENVWVEDFSYAGFDLPDSFDNYFLTCRFRNVNASANTAGAGVWYRNQTFTPPLASTGDLFENCYFSGCRVGASCVATDRADYHVFNNCFFESNGTGIDFTLSQKIVLLGCYFEANSVAGATLQSGMDIQCRKTSGGAITYSTRGVSLDDTLTEFRRGATDVFKVDLSELVQKVTLALMESGALRIGTATTSFFAGNGTPESSITASNSSTYYQKDGYRNQLWLKRSGGSSNTGWRQLLAQESGSTASRPGLLDATYIGFIWFDTTLGKPIWWNGTGWVDATGASV